MASTGPFEPPPSEEPTPRSELHGRGSEHLQPSLVREIQRNSKSEKTRKAYLGMNKRFVAWALAHYEDLSSLQSEGLISENWRISLQLLDEKHRLEAIKDTLATCEELDNTVLVGKLNLECLHFNAWAMFLAQQRKRDFNGRETYLRTYGNYRSALKHLYRHANVPLPEWFDEQVTEYMNALRRISAHERGVDPNSTHERGKMALPYQLYCAISKKLLVDGVLGALLIHVFSWNLAARAHSTCGLCLSHLQWENDGLRVYIPHQKNDQDGEKQGRFPKHVYANPSTPEICPLFCLAAYLACFEVGKETNAIFPHANIYAAHSAHMERFKQKNKEILQCYGLDPSDIGTHSNRKGASTYVTSGITDGPSMMSICNRAGWDTAKVLGTYSRYESAGDQYIGRIVAGHTPASGSKFAQLPPHFIPGVDMTVARRLARLTFTAFGKTNALDIVLEQLLANLLYHEKWIQDNLPGNHPLRSIPLWRDSSRSCIADFVSAESTHDRCGNDMSPTGIPMNVHILSHCEKAASKLNTLKEDIHDVLLQCMQERDFECGNITPATIRSVVSDLVTPLFQRLEDAVEMQQPTATVEAGEFNGMLGLLRLPASPIELPTRVTVRQAFVSYISGELPWIRLTSAHVRRQQRPHLADLHYLMGRLVSEAERRGEWDGRSVVSPDRADEIYQHVQGLVPSASRNGRKLSWRTAATYLRKRESQRDDGGEADRAAP